MIDQRILRVGIEVDGKLNVYSELPIRATGTKYTNPLQNESTITISGLNADTRNFILTETSRFNNNRSPKRVIVECGRESTGFFTLFVGDIVTAEPAPPPDLTITITAKTNNANNGRIVVVDGDGLQKLSDISKTVADRNGLSLLFEATEKNIANFSFSGVASRLVYELERMGRVNAFVDDDMLIVKDRSQPLTQRRRILNADSGMVGMPKQVDDGVEVSYLIDSESLLGGQLTIQSRFNPATNGDYTIGTLKYDVSNHEDAFFYTAVCKPL